MSETVTDGTEQKFVTDWNGIKAPADVDGIDLDAVDECPVCTDREKGLFEQPAGYYTCRNCWITWSGDFNDAVLVSYTGQSVETDAERGGSDDA